MASTTESSMRCTVSTLSRREFIGQMATAGIALAGSSALMAETAAKSTPPIVVFSKVYQELKLNFEEAADITAEAGLNGIDCPVRPGGEVIPQRIAEDLPRYADALRRKNLKLSLLTTAITNVSSTQAEALLRLAKSLGVRFYRLGFIERKPGVDAAKQISEVRGWLKELAALNKEIGICGLLQNHSPSGRTVYFGGNLEELREAVDGLDPAEMGIAFDIGHALVVHGDNWRVEFEKLKPHFKIAYVKDVNRGGGWVPFGQGDIAGTGYFGLLRQMGYASPVSMHIEFDWTDNGKAKNRTALLNALKSSSQVLQQWLASA